MRLYSFQIQNFKSIINTGECKISDIDNIVVLAGQNESGKSSVLEALDFFANGPSDKFEKFEKRQGTDMTSVKCTFLIGKSDMEYLEGEFEDYEEIKKFLKKKKEVSLFRKFENKKDSGLSIDESFFEDFPEFEEEEAEDEAAEETTTTTTPPAQAQPATAQASDTNNRDSLMEKLSEAIIEVIPTVSLYNSFEDLLPSEIAVTELKNSKAVKDFEKVFGVKLNELAEITDARERKIKIKEIESKATDDFNQFWSQKISSVTGTNKYRFLIEVNDAEPKKIIFMIEGEDQTPLYLEQKSMGFRWFSAFHLRLRALMKESEDYDYEENDNNILILIDEPGQNLHDTAQKDVKKILDETAEKEIQILYSTHNPNLIGNVNTNEIEYTRIRIATNHPKQGTKVFNVPQFIARKDGGSIDALSPIRTAMGLNSAGTIFDKNKLNVVVEGITDNYYLTAFRELLKKDERLHFIPVCGVDNVKSMVGLLIGWGMDYKAVFDDDPKQGRKAYNDLKKYYFEGDDTTAHEHILKIKGCNGIEDIFSKPDFKKILGRELEDSEKKQSNSEIVKKSGKELVARQFLEAVRKNPSEIKLNETSTKKIEEVFDWLYEKFSITKK
jgi:predicted ATP-dependent endonuclease of OLD family